MNNTEARINELNVCRKLLVDVYKKIEGTDKGLKCYGLREATRILMERKKELRAMLTALKASA